MPSLSPKSCGHLQLLLMSLQKRFKAILAESIRRNVRGCVHTVLSICTGDYVCFGMILMILGSYVTICPWLGIVDLDVICSPYHCFNQTMCWFVVSILLEEKCWSSQAEMKHRVVWNQQALHSATGNDNINLMAFKPLIHSWFIVIYRFFYHGDFSGKHACVRCCKHCWSSTCLTASQICGICTSIRKPWMTWSTSHLHKRT